MDFEVGLFRVLFSSDSLNYDVNSANVVNMWSIKTSVIFPAVWHKAFLSLRLIKAVVNEHNMSSCSLLM